MAAVESAALAVARVAVQAALAALAADKRRAEERRKELKELLPKSLGDRLRRTDAAGQLERLVEGVNGELDQWVQAEMPGLPANEQSAALLAIIEVFDRADLSDAALYDVDVDAGRLACRLRTEWSQVKESAQLSDAAGALHDRLLERSCELFVQMVQQIPAFLYRTLAETLPRFTNLEQQGAELLRRLPQRPRRTEPEYWATVREIRDRTWQLVGRRVQLAKITAFATGPPSYRWLVGGAWAGKTALLAEAAVAALPPEVDVLAYFASRREADADGERFLLAVVPQLEHLLGEDSSVTDSRLLLHRLRYLWSRAVEVAAAADRQLLLVVDGLDEDRRPENVPSIASLLPARLGARGHVLVASRPYLELPSDVDVAHPMQTTPPVRLSRSRAASHLAALAEQELDTLLRGERAELATKVFGVLTAAAGPLAVADVATLVENLASGTPEALRRVRRLVIEEAARTLQAVGPADRRRYTFAHEQLLKQAQSNADLSHPEYRRRIHRWASEWAWAGWPFPAGREGATPRYLLDSYPATLKDDPDRLMQLADDVGWLIATLHTVGVDRLLSDLATVADKLWGLVLIATLRSQAAALRRPHPVDDPSYLMRQLCLGALELGEEGIASTIRARLQALPDSGAVPEWTTRRVSPALIGEFSREDRVSAVAVAPGGQVVSGGTDGRVLVCDPAAPDAPAIELGRHDGRVTAVAVASDGWVVSGGEDGRVLAWDPTELGGPATELGRHVMTIPVKVPPPVEVSAVAVAPDGRVISSDVDGRVLVWNPPALAAAPIQLGARWVRTVAVTPDGRVVSGDVDGRVLVWDPAAPAAAPTELGDHRFGSVCRVGAVSAVAVAPDGRVISGGEDGRVLAWDPTHPGAPATWLGGHDGPVTSVAGAPDGGIASGGVDGRVLVRGPAAPDAPAIELGRHDGRVTAVAVAPDGWVVSGGEDGRVLAWDPTYPAAPRDLDLPYSRHRGAWGTWVMAVTSAGQIVRGGLDGRVLFWDPADPADPPGGEELGHHDGQVTAVASAPDGQVISGGADGMVLSWDPSRPGTPATELGGHVGPVTSVAVLPDGRVVSSGTDRRIRVWNPTALETAPSELVGLDGLGLFTRPSEVFAVAVTSDGRVVGGGSDGEVRVWNPATPGAPPIRLGRHLAAVSAVAAAKDGRVVSGGLDGAVLVWSSSRRGAEVVHGGRHGGWVRSLAVVPDGRVVSLAGDSTVRVWDWRRASPGAEIAGSATAFAVAPGHDRKRPQLLIAHRGRGISMWSLPLP